ncbi:MAG: YbaK/EbsC family protein [Pirellulales bacterium]|nr:YbaK/EbsC family protein [Pirellulales bacterium]
MDIQEFLNKQKIEYEMIYHKPTYDSQRLAQAVAETGYHVAKTVLLKSDADYILAVVPATNTIDLADVGVMFRSNVLVLATEEEADELFPDCEAGVIPPFGSQYGLTTLLDEALSEVDEIVFEGNTHDEAVRMNYADYFELEKPVVTRLSHPEND